MERHMGKILNVCSPNRAGSFKQDPVLFLSLYGLEIRSNRRAHNSYSILNLDPVEHQRAHNRLLRAPRVFVF